MLSYKLQKGHFQFFALVPTGVVGCFQVESMTRLVPPVARVGKRIGWVTQHEA